MNTSWKTEKTGFERIKSLSTFHRVCLREATPVKTPWKIAVLKNYAILKRKRGQFRDSRILITPPPPPPFRRTPARIIPDSRKRSGGRGMESRRPGYPNMTRPDTAGSHPLGAEPLIYSYLVSSTQAGCYTQGRIRILAIFFLIRWPQYYHLSNIVMILVDCLSVRRAYDNRASFLHFSIKSFKTLLSECLMLKMKQLLMLNFWNRIKQFAKSW